MSAGNDTNMKYFFEKINVLFSFNLLEIGQTKLDIWYLVEANKYWPRISRKILII